MTYFENEDVDEMVQMADHFLLESGVHRGKSPDVYASPHKLGGTSVDFVPQTNTLVFRGADDADLLELEEDTVKLLSKIYAGINNDYSWDSGAYYKLESTLENLPDTWELPFRDSSPESDVNDYVLGSELWKRRSGNLMPLIESTEERVNELQEIYDEKIEPVEMLDREMTPAHSDEENGMDMQVYNYFNSDLKNIFIQQVKFGDREVFDEYTEERDDEIYDMVDDEEKAESLINQIDENLPEIRETYHELQRQEERVRQGIRQELEEMLEQQEPEPEETAVAYMVPLLIHGRLDDLDMHDENLEYIDSISNGSKEVKRYATELYQEFLNTSDDVMPKTRFAQALEKTDIDY